MPLGSMPFEIGNRKLHNLAGRSPVLGASRQVIDLPEELAQTKGRLHNIGCHACAFCRSEAKTRMSRSVNINVVTAVATTPPIFHKITTMLCEGD